MRILLLTFFTLLNYIFATAQDDWRQNFSSPRVFIENKGQFDDFANETTGKIEFAADFGSTRVFFGKNGISYWFLDAQRIPKDERAHLEAKINVKTQQDYKQWEKVIGKFHYRSDQVNMVWDKANCIQILAEGARKDHHSYAFNTKSGETANINYIKGYEKITYKNLYPNIDVEYVIHPKQGLKYAVILHPGANPNDVKMHHDREARLEDGKIKIATLFGDIVDHEPFTFYKNQMDQVIQSSFQLKNNTVSFQLADYDKTKTIVIDPWTQTPDFPSNWDCIWEVETDAAGNVYAIGGILPMQLLKYNQNGALQWTFNTPYDTVGGWLGSIATTDLGESFVCNGSSAKILSVNTNGGLNWSNNSPQGASFTDEFWTISFNCDQSKLVIGGARLVGLNPSPRIFDVNVSNGNVLSSFQVTPPPTGFGAGHEVRAITECNNEKYYYLTHDTLGFISTNFSACGGLGASNIKYGSQHNFSYKNENFREGNSGIQALKTFGEFVFVHRGDIIEKRNFNTGAIVSTVNIPGGLFINNTVFGITTRQVGCSGIDIDVCGNVYVGATNGVVKFNQDLVFQASYPTSFIVYDVQVSTNGNIIAGGSTGTNSSSVRSGGIQQFSANACDALAIACCDASICPISSLCVVDAPISLTASTPGGTWSGPGMNATGTFNPALAGVGTHTITYTLPCGSETQTVIVSPCLNLSVCIETDGSYTVSNGVGPYTWQNQTTVQNCSACLFGCAFPPGCAVNVLTWSTFATGTNIPAPTTFPIRVIDNTGTEIIINSAADLEPCDNSGCPTITAINNFTHPTCPGLNNGSASVNASGGNAPYNYTWTFGSNTFSGSSQQNLAPGTYTITMMDADSCIGTTSITLIDPPLIVISVDNITSTDCGASTGSASVSAVGGTGNLSYSWNPNVSTSASATNLGAGIYTVTVQDANGCQQSSQITINTDGGPIIDNIVSINPLCHGQSNGQITVTASGGSGSLTYQLGTNAPQNSNVFENLSAGTYEITVYDANNCAISQMVTITDAPVITINTSTDETICIGDSVVLSASASGGTGTLSITWNSDLSGTSPTVSPNTTTTFIATATDENGCEASSSVIITVLPLPIAQASPAEFTGSTPLTMNFSNNSNHATSYVWNFGNGQTDTTNSSSNVSATYNQEGTYNVTLIASNGICFDTWQGIVIVIPVGDLIIHVPNVFSPNGDGSNDLYGIFSTNAASQEAYIYNRWGNLMAELNEPNSTWDGKVNGNNASEGVYFLKYRVIGLDGTEQEGQTFFHLILK